MGTLTEQMRNLAADITSSRDERHAWLGALREEVGALRGEIRSGWRERKSEVDKMRGDIRADLRGARRAWHEATAVPARSGAETSPARRARPSGKRHR